MKYHKGRSIQQKIRKILAQRHYVYLEKQNYEVIIKQRTKHQSNILGLDIRLICHVFCTCSSNSFKNELNLIKLIRKYQQIYYYVLILPLFLKQMGNSNDFDKIRSTRIEQRNNQLSQYSKTFESIISKSSLSQSLIDHIIRSDVVQIVHLLNKRHVTSEQLVAIYGLRAATIGKDLCIITEDNFQFALRKARQCDNDRFKTNKNNFTLGQQWDNDKHLPPLFGVPVSIKDNIQMESTAATLGLTARANQISKNDSPHIVCMKNSGMIPFVKTNLPQLAFAFDSHNFLWGRVLNPWNHNKSAGGSSGGEGASLATGISPIGLANDQGGSIRIPSHFCGVSGLLPSVSRLHSFNSETKCSTAFSGKNLIPPVNGPMGRSIDTIALWMKVITTEQYYAGKNDPYTRLVPFDLKQYGIYQDNKKKLRVGYFNQLQMVECTPACSRAVTQTVQYLKSQGNQIIQITLPNETEIICSMFAEMVGQGNFQAFVDALDGEQLIPQYSQTATITQLNCCLYGLVQCIMDCSQPRLGTLLKASKKMSTFQYQKMVGRVKQLRAEWVSYWRKLALDVVICPSFGSQALNHGASAQGDLLAAYVFIWNVLGVPVVTTPVTRARQDEQRYDSVWDDDIAKVAQKSAIDSAGLPVGIQIVGLPFQEQKILGVAKRIQQKVKFYTQNPLPINQKRK